MSNQDPPMDRLHQVMMSLRTESKSASDHHRVFREFLSHLDHVQRKPPARRPRSKPPLRRRAPKRTK